jgi:riboflavin kinase/FMN adenylyltransferase
MSATDPAATPPTAAGPPMVAAIGAFDGVHRGHQVLLTEMVARATELGARALCVTFDPDPEQVLRPDRPGRTLAPIDERVRLIRQLGVHEVYLWPFTATVARMRPEEFVGALCARYRLIEVWVGADFRFGRDRTGTVADLVALGRRFGFAVQTRAPVYDGDRPISSTRIRELLAAGDVAEAARLLGRPYRIAGEVIEGARRGRRLGFPTANLPPPRGQALPAEGVYAGRALLGDTAYDAVANVGRRPTFDEEQPLIEVHLLDFAGDLYRRHLAFDFVAHLRGTRKFDSAEALQAQIARDIEAARAALRGLGDPRPA